MAITIKHDGTPALYAAAGYAAGQGKRRADDRRPAAQHLSNAILQDDQNRQNRYMQQVKDLQERKRQERQWARDDKVYARKRADMIADRKDQREYDAGLLAARNAREDALRAERRQQTLDDRVAGWRHDYNVYQQRQKDDQARLLEQRAYNERIAAGLRAQKLQDIEAQNAYQLSRDEAERAHNLEMQNLRGAQALERTGLSNQGRLDLADVNNAADQELARLRARLDERKMRTKSGLDTARDAARSRLRREEAEQKFGHATELKAQDIEGRSRILGERAGYTAAENERLYGYRSKLLGQRHQNTLEEDINRGEIQGQLIDWRTEAQKELAEQRQGFTVENSIRDLQQDLARYDAQHANRLAEQAQGFQNTLTRDELLHGYDQQDALDQREYQDSVYARNRADELYDEAFIRTYTPAQIQQRNQMLAQLSEAINSDELTDEEKEQIYADTEAKLNSMPMLMEIPRVPTDGAGSIGYGGGYGYGVSQRPELKFSDKFALYNAARDALSANGENPTYEQITERVREFLQLSDAIDNGQIMLAPSGNVGGLVQPNPAQSTMPYPYGYGQPVPMPYGYGAPGQPLPQGMQEPLPEQAQAPVVREVYQPTEQDAIALLSRREKRTLDKIEKRLSKARPDTPEYEKYEREKQELLEPAYEHLYDENAISHLTPEEQDRVRHIDKVLKFSTGKSVSASNLLAEREELIKRGRSIGTEFTPGSYEMSNGVNIPRVLEAFTIFTPDGGMRIDEEKQEAYAEAIAAKNPALRKDEIIAAWNAYFTTLAEEDDKRNSK